MFAAKKAMAAFIGVLVPVIFAISSAAAGIPIIDAHSQVDHFVELEDVIRLMDKGGVSRTILGMRGRVKPKDLAAFAGRHPGRITPAVRTKGWSYVENRPKYYRFLKKQLRMPEFGALGEVLLFHAQKGNKAPEWEVWPGQPQVQAPLRAAIERKWPFIAHIEFAATFEHGKWMEKFEALLRAHPAHPFPLIHMGQLPAKDAGRLIKAHPNVYFMTSHANTISVSRSGQPWVNMFDGEKLTPAWKKLIVRHPDRFILAFDNVWEEHWGEYYLSQIRLWRKGLAELPTDAANALAHGNAERLWRLPPAKSFPLK